MASVTYVPFPRRIEAEFRPSVRAAVKSTSLASTNKRIAKNFDSEESSVAGPSKQVPSKQPATVSTTQNNDGKSPKLKGKQTERKTDFDVLPTRTSLRDVAMAPPTLSRATRNAPPKSMIGTVTSSLSMAQKVALEEEREKVIRRYRELKEAQRAEAAAQKESEKGKKKTKRRRTDDEDDDGYEVV